MFLARARAQTGWSGDEYTNNKAAAYTITLKGIMDTGNFIFVHGYVKSKNTRDLAVFIYNAETTRKRETLSNRETKKLVVTYLLQESSQCVGITNPAYC